ncbi:right-handed parallel beta-helix repeat-containing protein [Leucobacter allii]|uniref:Right-handed parallel beta-helix repeat-containing protein n=1 Tax=Leucobacter allii TaxID=2932247 RepID=A0ABY4FMU0_9MICO|nr:right-handed parallel beta-helix repeat-containing protein [Leucobacter allii]UOQ57582.1 right-handed parallel beta-helix repeat-containing protein [Leucobacter allii]
MRTLRLPLAAIAVACALLLGACSTSPGSRDADAAGGAAPRVVEVPGDADTAQAGADLLRPGDMLLLGPGTYREELVVATPDVTIRGADRNAVVFDGEGSRSQGVLVIADGVRVQNLTVHSYLYNGVLVTGMHDGAEASAHGVSGYDRLDPEEYPPLQRYAIEHVTAYNNGLYGLYAFNAQHGRIADSYASGSADSGIYVGQCEACDVVVSGNVAEGNAIGFENANASAPVTISGNRFSGNRVGMTLISNYQEAYAPQRGNEVAGNLVADNANPETPAQADGAFGIGIGIAGGQANLLRANRITGHPDAGVLLRNGEDFAASDTRVEDSVFAGNAVDVGDVSAAYAAATGNCVSPAEGVILAPAALGAADCATAASTAVAPHSPEAPAGRSFLDLPAPPAQPQLDGIAEIPDPLPDVQQHPDPATARVPEATLLQDRIRP